MQLTIDPDGDAPPFEQVRRQLEAQIEAGALRVGDKLPPVRQLAATLELANGTVARAYRELEHAGLIETRGRAGTLVAAPAERRAGQLRTEAAAYVEKARLLTATDEEILSAVAAVLGVRRG